MRDQSPGGLIGVNGPLPPQVEGKGPFTSGVCVHLGSSAFTSGVCVRHGAADTLSVATRLPYVTAARCPEWYGRICSTRSMVLRNAWQKFSPVDTRSTFTLSISA